MNAMRHFSMTSQVRGFFASMALAAVLLGLPSFAIAAYEGAEYCIDCHDTQYAQWKGHGHLHIFMNSDFAKHRPIPLPEGKTYDDISYVVGGFKWKSLYLDTNGNIITSGNSQFNFLTGEWTPYQSDGTPQTECGSCHTTGWQAGGGALPGLGGTFALEGVQCEACHGEGDTMEVNTSSQLCGTCHSRGATSAIAASGGFIRHNAQYNEYLASPHSGLNCVSCHNPHVTAQAGAGIKTQCEDCHADQAAAYAQNHMSEVGVECIDCHMPFATLSAQPLGPKHGDVKTHIFRINTDPNASLFTPDGSSVVLDGSGKGAVTLDFACQRCHTTATMAELAKFANNFHSQSFADIGLTAGLSGNWWGGPSRDGEGFFLDFGYSNNQLTLFASFFTYDNVGNQAWLIAIGPATSGTSVNADIYIAEGRMWGDNFNPADGSTPVWGTGTFSFSSCTAGSISLQPNQTYVDQGFSNLTYNLQRDLLSPAVQCPTFVNDPQ